MADFVELVIGVDTRGLKKGERALDDTTRAGRKTERATDGAAAGMGRLGATSGGVAAAGMRKFAIAATAAVGALVAVVAAGAGLNKFVSSTVEADAAQAQLAAALLSTGGAAGKTIGQLNAHASALQGVTKFGDEATNAMQGVLLTFTQIQGGTFDKATVATMDLATAMGTDLKAAALQVGKALNDPVLGMTALSRSGIQFTEAQKDVVKSMVATNDIAGAQGIILGELEKQFGGSAAAARDTLGGALAALGNSFGDLFELSGPATEKLRSSIDGLIETITTPSFVAGLQNIGALLFGIAGAALKVVGAFGSAIGVANSFVAFLTPLSESERAIVAVSKANDIGTLAMSDQIEQIQILTRSTKEGSIISEEAARVRLSEAKSLIATLDATRELNRERANEESGLNKALQNVARFTAELEELRSVQARAIEDGLNLPEGLTGGAEEFAASLETAERNLAEVQSALGVIVNSQRGLNNLSDAQIAQRAELVDLETMLSAGIIASKDGQVFLNGELIRGVDVTGALARLAGDTGANLNAASGEAAQLARNLSQAASALSSVMSATANINVSAIGMEAQNKALEAGNTLIQARTAGLLAAKRVELADAFGSSDGAIRAAAAAELESYTEAVMRNSDAQAVNEALTKAATAAIGGGGGGGGGGLIKAAEDLTPALDDAGDAAEDLGKAKAQILVSGIDSMAGAFGDFVSGGLKDFKSFASSIVDTFKRMLSQMIAMAVKNKILIPIAMSSMGLGTAANAANATGSATGLMGGIAGIGSALGTGFMSSAGGFLSGGISGGMGAIGAQLSATAAGGFGAASVAASIGAVAAPLLAVVAVFSFFKKKTKELDSGIKITTNGLDTMTQSFRKVETSRFWGLSKKIRTSVSNMGAGGTAIQNAISDVQANVLIAAASLNIGADAFSRFSSRIKISTKGMNSDQANAAVNNALSGFADKFASTISGLRKFSLEGEGASDTLVRLATGLQNVNAVFETLGFNTYNVSLAGAGAASQFAQLFGSLQNFTASTGAYYDQFFTNDEKMANATARLTQSLASLGIDFVPQTKSAFRDLVDTAMLGGDSDLAAQLIMLAPAFSAVTDATNRLADAMNTNENAFATGVDFRRGLSRAANNIAYSPEKSQAEMLAELKSLNARIDVLQSTSEITANSSSQTAENTDYTNALTLEAAT